MQHRELYVFPTRDKKPLTPQGFKNARLESQWSGQEGAQWGVPCGGRNGFIVIDVDAQHGGLETAKDIDWGGTFIVPTPSGGYHVYYKYDEKTKALRTSVGILRGIDIRAEGGYVIAYTEINQTLIKAIPQDVLSLLTKDIRAGQADPRVIGAPSSPPTVEGGRNAFITRAAGKMQRLGVLTLAGLLEVNERECLPPLDDSEVETIFKSVSRYSPEPEEQGSTEASAQELIAPMLSFLKNDAAVKGESTGIAQLDDLLGGGKRLGELSVMLAEAKSGKNTFWHYQMVNMLDRGVAIAYASRELDPATEVMPNLVTLAMDRNVYKHEMNEADVLNRIKGWSLVFSEGIGQYDDVSELFLWLEEKIKEGVKFLWIDHLHFCLPDSEDFKAVSNFIRRLRTLARENMVHVDLIIQPKGGTTQHNKSGKLIDNDLDIGMLRGGASLGQGLDNLITMQRVRDEDGDKTDVSRIALKTSRNKLAKLGSFFVAYDRDTMTFSSCAKPRELEVEEEGPPNKWAIRAKRAATSATRRQPPNADTPLFDLSANGYNLRKGL